MAAMLDQLARTQPTRRINLAHADRSQPGFMNGDALRLPPDTTAYLCGPFPFMHGIRAGLIRRGLGAEHIHYEVFGPGMLDWD
ncbi:hypothetical protein ABTX61_08835 [Amycolatopsis japonica]|uniref:hypothetical protein n=1 Tax=Amycolatopsis japonica TaxID=208439 RepID=UPI00331651B1